VRSTVASRSGHPSHTRPDGCRCSSCFSGPRSAFRAGRAPDELRWCPRPLMGNSLRVANFSTLVGENIRQPPQADRCPIRPQPSRPFEPCEVEVGSPARGREVAHTCADGSTQRWEIRSHERDRTSPVQPPPGRQLGPLSESKAFTSIAGRSRAPRRGPYPGAEVSIHDASCPDRAVHLEASPAVRLSSTTRRGHACVGRARVCVGLAVPLTQLGPRPAPLRPSKPARGATSFEWIVLIGRNDRARSVYEACLTGRCE
jgi:hypothetical protein